MAVVVSLGSTGCESIASRTSQPLADQRNLIDEVRISQDDINQDAVPFEDLLYAGKHIFSNRFTTEDHYGEGPQGPRRSRYTLEDREDFPFLRFNGLDSQSCLECHSSIGFAPQKNYPRATHDIRFGKQLGFAAGGAGFASNAFGFANFGCRPGTAGCDTNHLTRGVVRSPPHAFGAGYIQTLAEEMSWDLQEELAEARANPGNAVNLVAKGVSFGTIVVDQDGVADLANLEGVSADLVVRPFQWRGIASNLRNFIRDAMNFHFSVQPKEFLDDPNNQNRDDRDGARDEILEGEVSAVAAFLAFLRPPTESSEGLDAQVVDRGRKAFGEADCGSCHVPSLTIDNPYATIRDPRTDLAMVGVIEAQRSVAAARQRDALRQSSRGVEFITVPSGVSPTLVKYAARKQRNRAAVSPEAELSDAAVAQAVVSTLQGFSRNLNRDDGPPETRPRLPDADGRIPVPLYSDLRRHRMGENLAEPFPQKDDGGRDVPGDVFLTRPLWGVADTGPWLHDGRALTLTEAILSHEGAGSEANASIAKFKAFSTDDKMAIRVFLSSLRLPTVPH